MKKYMIIMLFIYFFMNINVHAETTYGTYDDAIKIVKESMKSYYIREEKIQYYSAKTTYPISEPEEATSQDTLYSVCSAFTNGVYANAFGVKTGEFPRYSYNISGAAKAYYDEKIKDKDKIANEGTFLIYYQHALVNDHDPTTCTENKIKYLHNDTDPSSPEGDLETLINNIKPGDLFVYTGHAFMAYDVVNNPNTKNKDVLMLQSTADDYISSRLESTNKLSYTLYPSPYGANGYLDINKEGSIQFFWLSELTHFVKIREDKSKILSCQEHECAVIRPFYEDENGNAVFNYTINAETKDDYNKGLLRTKYPALLIEKTVNVGDNNNVYLEDELVYSINISNKSDKAKPAKDYGELLIEEDISEMLNYVSYEILNENGTNIIDRKNFFCDFENNKLTCKIAGLTIGSNLTVKFKTKVKKEYKNIGQKIESIGKFYNPEFHNSDNEIVSISTGTVVNKIIPKNNYNPGYAKCYDRYADSSYGVDLIYNIYKCAWGETDISVDDLGLNYLKENFNFSDIFTLSGSTKNNAKISLTKSQDSDVNKIQNMIFNNYYSGLLVSNGDYLIPNFRQSVRADTINENDFKNGDILLYYITNSKYTNENGLYAFIYINNSNVKGFIGGNYIGEANERRSFRYQYYVQDYAIQKSQDSCDKYDLSVGNQCNYSLNLYRGYFNPHFKGLESEEQQRIMNYVNLQTLFAKDYYVILRPELLVKEKGENETENIYPNKITRPGGQGVADDKLEGTGPQTGIKDYVLLISGAIVLAGIGTFIVLKKKGKFIKL